MHAKGKDEQTLSRLREPAGATPPRPRGVGASPCGRGRDIRADTQRDDVVLLQVCCHNPTGVDPLLDDWEALAESAARGGWVPFV
ncbi:aminotransferase class I/II-fold pyridoxal phosphate-dependent enzyme, partial [Streptomyces virginiae]